MIDGLPDGSVLVISMRYGSHVYGTELPTSDADIKGVYLPPSRDILLQRVQATIVRSTKTDPSRTNTAKDVDVEYFSLQRFFDLLLEGQTNALDMLFTPAAQHLSTMHPAWVEVQAHRARFLHSGVTMFARYCRQQAAKYGMKGSRIAALRAALGFLTPLPDHDKIEAHREALERLATEHGATGEGAERHLRLVQIDEAPLHRSGTYLEVAGRKVPMGATVKLAKQTLQRVFEEFGQRALLAEKNQGIDWKALMHAVRVANQAEELLRTGMITFPRPERKRLLEIRQGFVPYREVAEMIEDGVAALEAAAENSILPTSPDRGLAEEIIQRHYTSQISARR